MVQFENAAALARAEEIVAVAGIDMVMIGTNDLLCDWGIPEQYEHPQVREAYATDHRGVPPARQARGRRRPRHAARSWSRSIVQMGARYVSTGTDLAFLMGACAQRAKQVPDIVL